MQIKVFQVPVLGGEDENEALNKFLRSHKVIGIEQQLIKQNGVHYWVFCVKYITGLVKTKASSRPKVDYREVLQPQEFARFSRFREIRKQISDEQNIPVYAIFTNEELANMARVDELTIKRMLEIPGIGDKKTEKYGARFIETLKHAADQKPDR